MSRILIAYASSYGQTRKIGEALAAELRRAGHVVELADVMAGRPPPAQDYDAVVLGSRVQYGVHAKQILTYIAEHRAELERVPTYFFSVSMSAAGASTLDPQGYLEKLSSYTHWRPRDAIAIGGGLPYRQYGPLLRFFMKLISGRNGHSTDTRRDHDYTDWNQVKQFATRIISDLVPRPRAPEAPRVRV